ncbi:hypothetical protein [Halorubrum gandharaense]
MSSEEPSRASLTEGDLLVPMVALAWFRFGSWDRKIVDADASSASGPSVAAED